MIGRFSGIESEFYHSDGLGSAWLLTNELGVVGATYTYDAYGNLIAGNGSSNNAYLFAGEQRDKETGLDYLRARYYDPFLGRFISADAYEGTLADPMSLHDYQYAHANPVVNTDPTGYFSIAEIHAAESIRNILAGIQVEIGSYLVSATLKGGDYDMRDFLTDLTWGTVLAVAPIVLPEIGKGMLKLVTRQIEAQKINQAAKIVYNLGPEDFVNKATVRNFGTAIGDNPIALKAYSRLQNLDAEVYLDFTTLAKAGDGSTLYGKTTVYNDSRLPRVDIYMLNHKSGEHAAMTLIHEGKHVERALGGFALGTRYEEYLAFRRELVAIHRRKPTLEERRKLWEFVNQTYSHLPVGKSPFGS